MAVKNNRGNSGSRSGRAGNTRGGSANRSAASRSRATASRRAPASRSSSGASRRKSPPKKQIPFKKIGLAILLILLALAVAFGALAIAYVATDGFGGRLPTIVAEHDGVIYTANDEDLVIYSDSEINVRVLSDKTYKVQIFAKDSSDFAFTIGEEPYEWGDLAGQELTSGFELTGTKTGFKITYTTLEDIIERVRGMDVTIAEDVDLTGDLFELVITAGSKSIRLGFGIGLPVGSVELDPDHLIL